jgi:hypothetical protein
VNSAGNAFVTGFTQSSDFPTAAPVQSVLGISGGSACGSTVCADAFVTQLNPSGGGITYSTYLGGSGADFGQAIVLGSTGDPYIAGSTASTNFPVIAGSYQSALAGVAGNAFMAKIDSANSPAMALAPAKLNFGDQALSVRSPARTVTLINAGSAPLQITAITSPTADFTETDDCIGTVSAGGGSCTINVTYTPSALGAVTDTFSLTDNAAGSPHTITVTGTGVAAATAVTVAPTSISFGNQNVGTVSAPQTVTITNTGTATLNITQITVGGDFVQTNTCAAKLNVLNVGESCTVSVVFQPTASGARTGGLSIADNASGSPQSVTLSGTGIALFAMTSPAPTSTVVIGSTTATFTVSATAPSNFTGNITPSCSNIGTATCTFNPTTIFVGQQSTLTISNLTATTTNPLNFTLNGTSGSQTATLPMTLLLADYTLTVSPALNTIVAGQPAGYTVLVTPLYGFSQAVQLSCTNLPSGSTCGFSQGSVTPHGSPASVTMTVTTTKTARFFGRPDDPFRGPPALIMLWLVCLAGLGGLLYARKRGRAGPFAVRPQMPLALRLVALGVMLAVLSWSSACRSITSVGTTGNFTITVQGILTSNTSVIRTTTFNLAIT